MHEKPRVTWLTNLAAPYRVPLWQALDASCHLTVLLLEHAGRLRRDHAANRGADWGPRDDVPIRETRTLSLRRGEARYYTSVDPRLATQISRSDAVVLGGWESPAYLQALLVAKLRGVATIGFYESTLATQHHAGLIGRVRSSFFRTLDAVVVPGPAAREAVQHMGVESERIFTGFNSIDTQAFQAVRSARRAATPGHRFIYVGQLIERKAVDSILRAFAQMAGAHDTLRLVGRGPLAGSLQRLAKELRIDDRLTWTEFLPNREMPAVFAEADTLVLASHEEVWGLVVNEALAAGLQVVVTRNCGVVRSVETMQGVFVTESASTLSAGMTEAIREFSGRIQQPEILEHTPQRFAETFTEAIRFALRKKPQMRRSHG